MIDMYLVTGVIVTLAVSTAYAFMINANIRLNRAANSELSSSDYDSIMSYTRATEY